MRDVDPRPSSWCSLEVLSHLKAKGRGVGHGDINTGTLTRQQYDPLRKVRKKDSTILYILQNKVRLHMVGLIKIMCQCTECHLSSLCDIED